MAKRVIEIVLRKVDGEYDGFADVVVQQLTGFRTYTPVFAASFVPDDEIGSALLAGLTALDA